MKVVLQRVKWAKVSVAGEVVGQIEQGLLALIGCLKDDDEATAKRMAQRIANYRIFPDESGKTNLNVSQANGELLVISQFTISADTKKGRRPSFDPSLNPHAAAGLIEAVCRELTELGLGVSQGAFGKEMSVELLNFGPATYILDVE